MKRTASVWLVLYFLGGLAYAQVTTGTVSGTVSDTSGAVLPQATVIILNADTGVSRTVTTDGEGRYTAPSLGLGNYKVTASLSGFETEVRSGIVLTVGREAVVDFQLKVGAVTESVQVTGEAPLVETTQSSVSALVDNGQMEELPIAGRNMSDLITLAPGADKLEVAATAIHRGFGEQISISGLRTDDNLFLLDGTDMSDYQNNSPAGPNGIMYGQEGTREMQILTSNLSAQYGRMMGGVFNSVSKSGTNSFHGDAFEMLRNNDTDSRNFFDPAVIPPFRRNQFGGSIGGPIRKDRTFFHLSYEGLRSYSSLTNRPTVPGLGLRQGIIPDSSPQGSHQDVVSPIAASIIPYWPLPTPGAPTFAGNVGQYVVVVPTIVGTDFFQTRLDHQISDKDSLFGRFTFLNQNETDFANTPGYQSNTSSTSRFFTLSETRIISPQTLNSFRVAFNRNSLPQHNDAPNIPPLQFFPNYPIPGNFSVTGIGLTFALANFGPDFFANTNRYEAIDDVTMNHGNHSIQFGGNFQRAQENQEFENYPQGVYSFNSWEGFVLDSPSALGSFRGTPLADGNFVRGFRLWYLSGYVQDDWRVRSNLTVNLGVRYDFQSVPTEANGLISNFRNIVPGDLAAAGQYVIGNPLWQNPTNHNFEPRAGLVWDPFGNGKTSVRLGSGLFYARLDARDYWGNRDGDIAKGFAVATPLYFPNAALEIANSHQTVQVFNTNYNLHTPHDWEWTANIQQQLTANTLLSVGYTGNRGIDLIGIANFNAPQSSFVNGVLTAPANGGPRNPTITTMDYTTSQGDSWYNALSVDLKRRLTAGLQFDVVYTYSKAESDADQTSRAQLASNRVTGYFLDPAYISADKSLSPWNATDNLKVNFAYSPPFGPQGHWLRQPGVASYALGGWQVTGIVTVKSGSPYTYTDSVNRTLSGMEYQEVRPNLNPGASPGGVICGTPDQSQNGQPCIAYFNASGFSYPCTLCLGNVGRLTGIAPGIRDLDMSMAKSFPLRERLSLQFRVDAFNVLNKANFGLPSTTVFGTTGATLPATGVITTTSVSPRQLQFNMKLIF